MVLGDWVDFNKVPILSITCINRFLLRVNSEIGTEFQLKLRLGNLEQIPFNQIGLVGG